MASVISAGTTSGTALNMTGDTSGQLQFQTNGTTAAVTIDTSQNVGIGIASPSAKLHVRASSTGSTAYGIMLDAGAQQHSWYLADNFTSTYSIGSSSGQFTWSTSGGERMRIDSSGNVLFARTDSNYLANQVGIVFQATSGTATFASSGTAARNIISFVNGIGGTPAEVGKIQTSASATSYLTSSDYRLKENVAPMTGALNTVAKLKPVTYNWKVDGSDGQGFIAHELQAVVPDCVSGEKDAVDAEGNPQYQGIDTSFLVATLTAAIQELTARVAALEAK